MNLDHLVNIKLGLHQIGNGSLGVLSHFPSCSVSMQDQEMHTRDEVDDLCEQVSQLTTGLKLDQNGQLFVPQAAIQSEADWQEVCQTRWPHDWKKMRLDPRLAKLSWEEFYKRVDDANVGLCTRMPSLVGIAPIFRQNPSGMPKINNLLKMNSVVPLGMTETHAFCLAQEKEKEKYFLYFLVLSHAMELEKINVVNLKKVEDADLVRANPVYQKYNQMLPFDGGSCPISHFAVHGTCAYMYDQVGDQIIGCDVAAKKPPFFIARKPTKCSPKCMRQIVVSRDRYLAVVYDHTLPSRDTPEGAYVHARFETALEADVEEAPADMEKVVDVMQKEYVCSFVHLYWLGHVGVSVEICIPNRERTKEEQETNELEMSLVQFANLQETDGTQTLKTKKKEENFLFSFHQVRCVAFHELEVNALFVSVDDGGVFRIPIAEPRELAQIGHADDASRFLASSISSGQLYKVDMGPSEEQDLQMFDHSKVSFKSSGRQPARWLHVGGADSLQDCMLLQGCESMLSGFMFGAFDEDKQAPDGHKQLGISRDTNAWRCIHSCANLFVAHSIKDNNGFIGRLTDFGPAQRLGDIQTVAASPSVDNSYQSVRCFADRIFLQQPNGSLIVAFPSDVSAQEAKIKALREHNAKQGNMMS